MRCAGLSEGGERAVQWCGMQCDAMRCGCGERAYAVWCGEALWVMEAWAALRCWAWWPL